MAPHPPDTRRRKSRAKSTNVIPIAKNSHSTLAKPFSLTHFGKLPPELREIVFIQLLAPPPPYASHNFLPISPDSMNSPNSPTQFVHIKASWYQVTRTCHQIYREARPIFFASRHYYVDDPKVLARFFTYSILIFLDYSMRRGFRLDTITALCLKNLVKERPMYTKEKIDNILLDPNDYRSTQTRQQLEMMTYKSLDLPSSYSLRQLKNLSTVGLCFRVGEEMFHVDLLYYLSGMRTGLVEFVDASHWLIRSQNPEDVWSIQSSCFFGGNYGKGKDDEDIPYDRCDIELDVTDIDSRAPGLKDGDERYIEAQILRPTVPNSLQRFLYSGEDDISRDSVPTSSDEDLFVPESDIPQVEVPQDQADNSILPGTLELETLILALESDASQNENSLFLELHSKDSQVSPVAANTDQEEEHDLFHSADEEVYGAQSKTQSDNQNEDPLPSSSYAPVTDGLHTATTDDRLFLLETEDGDDQAKIDTKLPDQGTGTDVQLNQEPVAESRIDMAQVQPNQRDRANRRRRPTNLVYLSSSSRQPLLDVQDTPNPYTEEEMESYEKWQEQVSSGTRLKEREEQSPPIKKMHEHRPKIPNEASPTATLREQPRTGAPLALLVAYVQKGAVFLLVLLIVVILERRLNASRDGED